VIGEIFMDAADKAINFIVKTEGTSAKVEIDGQDVSDRISAYQIHHADGNMPVLVLHQLAGVSAIHGRGIVQVVPDRSDASSVVGFLKDTDHEELDKAVLENLEWGNDTTMKVALEILIKWAEGKTP
jgi:hypothetical protein